MHLKLVFLWIPVLWAAFCCGVLILLERTGFFRARHFNLLDRGIHFELLGQPEKAEQFYREAMKIAPMLSIEDRTRLMVCLGDSLASQDRDEEAMIWFEKALDAGDSTGSCQQSICDLLLRRKTDPERALLMAEQAWGISCDSGKMSAFGLEWDASVRDLEETKYYARRANALGLLGRQSEAREAINECLKKIDGSRERIANSNPVPPFPTRFILGFKRYRELKAIHIADAHYCSGMALMALGNSERSALEFSYAREVDPKCKFGYLARLKLAELAGTSLHEGSANTPDANSV